MMSRRHRRAAGHVEEHHQEVAERCKRRTEEFLHHAHGREREFIVFRRSLSVFFRIKVTDFDAGRVKERTAEIGKVVIEQYAEVYPELKQNEAFVLEQFKLEETRFARTLRQGEREFEKAVSRMGESKVIHGMVAFNLYATYGFPIEMTRELAREHGLTVDEAGFEKHFAEHQKSSHAGAEQRFKGGLADHSAQTARLHTATHLLHAALRKVLGDEVAQKGSNITPERLRFDFSFGRKVTKDELAQVEALVNEWIKADVPVVMTETTVEDAKKEGAIGLFESKYGERVRMYTMGEYSKEICGGPHAGNTGDLGHFKIKKEEASSSGVRRIKAVLEY